ncbi:hypothetical protein F5141DRAFT_482278 [Pisolithus sp. B1]|nr:hypothetical protein F5141DRAFT_482278 [Pisolithus sp. B1]
MLSSSSTFVIVATSALHGVGARTLSVLFSRRRVRSHFRTNAFQKVRRERSKGKIIEEHRFAAASSNFGKRSKIRKRTWETIATQDGRPAAVYDAKQSCEDEHVVLRSIYVCAPMLWVQVYV